MQNKRNKKHFRLLIHILYPMSILYAFLHYITSPRATAMLNRRLWALETWIISSLYLFFLYIFISESDQDNQAISFLRKKFYSQKEKRPIRKALLLMIPFFFILIIKNFIKK